MKRYAIRVDDFCPTMNWSNWERLKRVLDNYNVKPLIGVIPDNLDGSQEIDPPKIDFWSYVIKLQKEGFVIAMHGFNHVYVSQNPKTMICGKKHSEFAGLSYDDQYKKIRRGKEILNGHGVYTDIFFAPGHTYDLDTLKALRDNGFTTLSDGLADRPYVQESIKCVPCKSHGSMRTMVIHPSEWISEEDIVEGIKQVKDYCKRHSVEDYFTFITTSASFFLGQKFLEKVYLFLSLSKKKVCNRIWEN